ncbi:MAG: MBOAT family protein [Hespellia sp.]|nr:MBOAT family protein [Hespellia sp.]
MEFGSISFLFYFLPIAIILYFIVPAKFRNLMLFICNIIFYAWGETAYVILLLISIGFNYICGWDIASHADDPKKSRRSLAVAVIFNVLLAGFFKYYKWVLGTLNVLFSVEIAYRELPIPLGISIYTLQILSYLIDVYRKKVRPQKNLLNFAVYVSMFPQMISGVIVSYGEIESQLNRRAVNLNKAGEGVCFFIRGLAKKILLANGMGMIVTEIMNMGFGTYAMMTAWVGSAAFMFQIYFELSGYSDMAVGLAKIFGFQFRRNFAYPYMAVSVRDFWGRWHVSLTNWFHEYVYRPLGSDKKGVARTIGNTILVWSMIGLWYNDSWRFLIWGFLSGVLLVMEQYVYGKYLEKLPKAARHIYILVLLLLGWAFFFNTSVSDSFRYIGSMFGIGVQGFLNLQTISLLGSNWLLFLLCIVGSTPIGYYVLDRMVYNYRNGRGRGGIACLIYLLMFFLTITFFVSGFDSSFLYFSF